jgi:hypothetical protein
VNQIPAETQISLSVTESKLPRMLGMTKKLHDSPEINRFRSENKKKSLMVKFEKMLTLTKFSTKGYLTKMK